MENNQIVFSTKLARILLKKKYVIDDIQPNKKNPQRTVFYFKNAPGLSKNINDYISMQEKN